ncbi:pentapeptide repeat protein [Actinobacteria bacterium IMCC26256]|nr:pentapeptide repeat protein [Actinobacteria bacterium IMCC26256]
MKRGRGLALVKGYEIGPGVNLRDANLTSSDLRGADLSCANLYGATLRSATLRDVNLESANLSEIIWDSDTICPEGFTPPQSASNPPRVSDNSN